MKLRRIEAIAATAIYLFIITMVYGQQMKNWEEKTSFFLMKPFNEQGVSFSFYTNHLIPVIIYFSLYYIAFLLVNNWIIPTYLLKEKRYEKGLIISLITLFALWVSFAYCEWAQNRYERHTLWSYLGNGKTYGSVFIIMITLTVYSLLKYGVIYLLRQKGNLTSRIVRESLIAAAIIAAIALLLMTVRPFFAIFWLIISLYTFLVYCLDIYLLLPYCTRRNYPLTNYLFIRIPLSLILYIPFGLLFALPAGINFGGFLVIWLCLNILLIPTVRHIYKRQIGHLAKLLNLETALGKSTADLSFLRSQINPHFLFNILNTLYGTALVEEAEMTASGIQKLGDMMRFMLHENMQDRILLIRELAYVQHYIDLQKLRTALSNNIVVEHQLQEVDGNYQIAPMLLIPFVENAFKHGISLKERSWIKINLYVKDGILYFDVYNSIHEKAIHDPEKDRNGIGLEIVQQRLQQLYPAKHELTIRQTNEEYFIHLTLVL
ncbi:hypothetical protein GCM10023231_19870 [Olivibacter ginsenosidimutans]|uniref:Signal transduction histidine kinase internal region domain-containing protein n=1 Tax=Olivibacter ginsenosidimutans TaxID=1176537 RepID=A0ABP9B7Z9_9SPHI